MIFDDNLSLSENFLPLVIRLLGFKQVSVIFEGDLMDVYPFYL